MKRLVLIFALTIALARVCVAAGYEFAIHPETAAGYSGGCTSAGSFNGQAVPRCTTTDGGFYVCNTLLGAANATSSFVVSHLDIAKITAAATGNICYKVSAASVTTGAYDVTSASTLSYGTASSLISTAVNPPTTGTKPVVSLGPTGAVTPKDNGTTVACAGSACNQHRLCIYVQVLSTGCTGAATTSVDVIGMSLTAQP